MITGKPPSESHRPVKSRYLSPPSSTIEPPPLLPASPNRQQKPKSSSKNTGFLRGVWPSSHSSSKSQNQNNSQPTTAGGTATLADYLGNDRKKDIRLSKQKSCSEFNRFENNTRKQTNLKENQILEYVEPLHQSLKEPLRRKGMFQQIYKNSSPSLADVGLQHQKPLFRGGSMRYTGKLRFTGRSSTSSSEFLDSGERIIPGRLSVDENALHRRRSESFSDDSDCSDHMGRNSPMSSYMAPTFSSRKLGLFTPFSTANSPTKSTIKNAMKKSTKWGSSGGRSESPPTPTSSSFSSRSKPPTSPSRSGKKNFLHMGLDLIKLNKKSSGSGCLSPLGSGMDMGIHELRMMHGSWMQWRYANARANVVNQTLDNKSKKDSLHALESITKLQQSVLQQRLQLEKEKLELKLNFLVHSQMKMLEAWRDMERKHISDISVIKDCLEVAVCRVPLIEGAKMDSQTTSIALRHATDLVTSVMSMTSSLTPTTYETVSTFSELAKIAIEEKLLLEECIEHFGIISTLEIQERSLRCDILEMISSEDQYQQY